MTLLHHIHAGLVAGLDKGRASHLSRYFPLKRIQAGLTRGEVGFALVDRPVHQQDARRLLRRRHNAELTDAGLEPYRAAEGFGVHGTPPALKLRWGLAVPAIGGSAV